MKRLHFFFAFVIWTIASVHVAYASHQVDFRTPTTIITTVGQLTTLQPDIKNLGASSERFHITISASSPNEIEITNADIHTQTVDPQKGISLFSNIRTLTENDNVLTIKIFRDGDQSHFQPQPPISILVKSKKISLPEFGLSGLAQIMVIASVLYFSFGARFRRASSR